ncbi:MAG: hypothetical protein ACRCU9_03205 [Iodobacter sp.]
MTQPYEFNPRPHRIDIKCPGCSGRAVFEFAVVCKIHLKADIAWFKQSTPFEYQQYQGTDGQNWHGALYYAGLHGTPALAIRDLPAGYTASDWAHTHTPQWLNRGSAYCQSCHYRAIHHLQWPGDAYYAVFYKQQMLWAFHRESASDLQAYLQASHRDIAQYRSASFLLHIPAVFKSHKARHSLVKQLQRLLAAQPRARII